MSIQPDKAKVEALVNLFGVTTRTHMGEAIRHAPELGLPRQVAVDQAIDETIAALAAFCAMAVSS